MGWITLIVLGIGLAVYRQVLSHRFNIALARAGHAIARAFDRFQLA